MTAPRPVTPLGIIAARLADLSGRLADADGVDPELRSALRDVTALAGGLEPYLSACTTPESPALRRLAERTEAEDWSERSGPLEREMLSGHVEGQALKFLVRLTRATRVLEIGMFTGYSALAMAEALPDGGTVVACEVDASVAALAQGCFDAAPDGHRIAVRLAPARVTLERLAAAGETFHLVFVDADKAGYLDYVHAVLDGGLLAPDGVICVDNTLLQGQPYGAGASTADGVAIAAFNRAIADDPRVEQVLLPLRDGLTLIRRA